MWMDFSLVAQQGLGSEALPVEVDLEGGEDLLVSPEFVVDYPESFDNVTAFIADAGQGHETPEAGRLAEAIRSELMHPAYVSERAFQPSINPEDREMLTDFIATQVVDPEEVGHYVEAFLELGIDFPPVTEAEREAARTKVEPLPAPRPLIPRAATFGDEFTETTDWRQAA